METVNFPCSKCGKLMAVTTDNLGLQVRCPHCQQVVAAPMSSVPTPAAAEEPFAASFSVSSEHEPDSIFSPPDANDEDLFGASPRPQIELPPGTPWSEAPSPPVAPELPPPAPAPIEPTIAYVTVEQVEVPVMPPMPAPDAPALELGPPADVGPPPSEFSATNELAPEVLEEARRSPPVRSRQGSSGWLLPIVIMPLFIWAVLATVLCFWLRHEVLSRPHPLEMIPDDGQYPGASHRESKSGVRQYEKEPLMALPPSLRVKLGSSIQVGDLKVTPTKVELRTITTRSGHFDPDRSTEDSLILHLELENVSKDVIFRPLDPAFDRKYKPKGVITNPPFTYLEMGDKRFFGGPCNWTPINKHDDPKEVVEGQNIDKVLRPGEKMDTFVCTDPDDKVAGPLAAYQGPLLYRVRVRRGLVQVRDREVPATAVVGVEFTSRDVIR